MFQELFNDINNISIQWVLTRVIALWKFDNSLGFQLPKWELIWECGNSFPHILLHSWEHEMWFPSSLLARTFASLCFDREPKARVVTCILHVKPRSMMTWNFNIINKKIILIDKIIGLCNYMSFAAKWVKWHEFIITSHKYPF